MGMLSQKKAAQGTYSTGTSSYPVTGFPASAYTGNNRRTGGGAQSQPSPIAGAVGTALNVDNTHLLIVLAALAGGGYLLWHLDNRK